MTDAELSEWIAYYLKEPFGPETAYHRTGLLASLIANIHRDSKKKPQPYTPADFMPDLGKAKKPDPMDPKHLKAAILSTFAGRVKKRGQADGLHPRGGGGNGGAPPETRPGAGVQSGNESPPRGGEADRQ